MNVSKVILYTTENCAKCKMIKKMLSDKGVEYNIGDNNDLIKLGYSSVPILKVDEKYYGFTEIIREGILCKLQ